MAARAGRGTVTSGTAARGHEGTTFELSCYTDPPGIEQLTGALAAAVSRVGAGAYGPDIALRFTTKFAVLGDLPDLVHQRRTRVRFSVNAAAVARRFEGGTSPTPDRLAGLRTLALAGYPVGLTIAPVMPVPNYADEYGTAGAGRHGAARRTGPGPDGRDHYPPFHPGQQGRVAVVVPADEARDG